MSLREVIDQRLKEAMKARDEIVVSVLRLVRAAIRNKEIDIKKALDDGEIVAVIKKMVKETHESMEQFQKGHREDLVMKAKSELSILESFLPAQLNVEELEKRVREIVDRLGATSLKQMGDVMKMISQTLAGQADMKEASRIVREILSG